MNTHVALDASRLPQTGFDHRMVTWWGTLGFMALEGMGFLLCYGVFLYVAWLNPQWPLGFPPQDPLWPSIFTALLAISLWPNWLVMRESRAHRNSPLRWLLVLMCAVGIAALVVRYFEFRALSLHWDDNAYGSMLWIFLSLHTLHLLTDVVDTMVMTALFFTGHVPEKRFNDAYENGLYWVFVVVAWLPLYLMLYWSNRAGGS